MLEWRSGNSKSRRFLCRCKLRAHMGRGGKGATEIKSTGGVKLFSERLRVLTCVMPSAPGKSKASWSRHDSWHFWMSLGVDAQVRRCDGGADGWTRGRNRNACGTSAPRACGAKETRVQMTMGAAARAMARRREVRPAASHGRGVVQWHGWPPLHASRKRPRITNWRPVRTVVGSQQCHHAGVLAGVDGLRAVAHVGANAVVAPGGRGHAGAGRIRPRT